MADEVIKEKIYCTPYHDGGGMGGGNNAPLWALAMQNKETDPMLASMFYNNNNMMNNNPMLWLIWLFALRWMNQDGYGNNTNAQIASLQSQMQDNHNNDLALQAINGNAGAIRELAANLNCDFNSLQQGVNSLNGAIQQVAGNVGFSAERVINAVAMGDSNVVQAIQNCCCNTQQAIQRMGYESQLATCGQTNQILSRMDQLASGFQTGLANIGFATQQQMNQILNGQCSSTQKVIDALNNHWTENLRDRLFEASQTAQTATLISALKPTTTTTATT